MVSGWRKGVAIGLVVLGCAALAEARIYRWTSEDGTPHFSDRPEDVPPAHRAAQAEAGAGGDDASEEGAGWAGLPVLPGTARSADAPEGDAAAPQPSEREALQWLQQLRGPMAVGVVLGFLVAFGLGIAFGALALLLGCRLLGIESPGFRRAYGVVIVQTLAGMAISPGVIWLAGGTPAATDLGALLRLQALNAVAVLAAQVAVLRAMLCERVGQALGLALVVFLVTLALGVLVGVLAVSCAGGAALLGGAHG